LHAAEVSSRLRQRHSEEIRHPPRDDAVVGFLTKAPQGGLGPVATNAVFALAQ
jgi:hypothetical protein